MCYVLCLFFFEKTTGSFPGGCIRLSLHFILPAVTFYTDASYSIPVERLWTAVPDMVMEDARILIALKDKIHDPSIKKKAKKKIRHLLDVTVGTLAV